MLLHATELRFEALTDGSNHPNGWPCRMLITSQSEARRFCDLLQPTHILSIKGFRTRYFGPTGFDPDHHLRMEFNDIVDSDGEDPPAHHHLEQMQCWMETLPKDARLLVHCLQGVHRSCAMGLGFLAQQTSPLHAASLLHSIRPQADPNRLMIKLLDERLKLHGELNAAADYFPCSVWKNGSSRD